MRKFVESLYNAATNGSRNEGTGITRRGFLIGSAGAGFTMAFTMSGLSLANPAEAAEKGLFEPTIWFRIEPDGKIVVNIVEAEMGQHVGTALARIVADELEADWDDVVLYYVDSDPKWGTMVTGGSWSVWQNFDTLSRAGAAGRQVLIEEGAKLLGVSPDQCRARDSQVLAGGRSVTYAQIVQAGNISRSFTDDELKKMPIKPPSERRLIGKDTLARDIPGKTNGEAIYGIDASVEGMVYGRPLIPPTRYGSTVDSVDDSQAKDVPGYQQTLVLDDPSGTVPGWAVVIADSVTAANKAAQKVKVNWTAGKTAKVTEKDILEEGRKLIADDSIGSLVVDDGDLKGTFDSADSVLEQEYITHSVLHFQMEPLNALAFKKDGRWEIHTGNQWQTLILPTLAKALGVKQEHIIMRTYLLGGGFGRRLNGDYAVPAALASKMLDKPVKLVFSREDDTRFDSIRSPSVQKLRMAFDADKRVIGMEHHATAGWPTQVMAPGFMPKGTNGEPFDPFSIQGADHWYSVGAQRLRAISNGLANDTFRPGWLRSVGSGWVNWALESFMDEAAHQAGQDPIDFRLGLLKAEGKNAGSAPNSVGGASRQANVLKRVRELSQWGQDMPADTALGVATSYGQERNMPTWTACVAKVHVDRDSGKVTLQHLTLVTDAGTVVHPDGARAQVEGAALWGASMALHEGTEIDNGEVKDHNLNSYQPMRMRDVPAMTVEFVDSTETSVGLGEPATTVVGPAIANAIFAAVGVRMRTIPIRREAVLEALKA
ncbi:putative membrane-bound aldehyde dehydrogenase (pyrroloquinoline-quinone-linked) [Marinobacter santoriniensis NKSG1]|uniref:Putative membrane-bound aldehyde dehydrogenase (Pyrroloquinoline-quinone-linked) n=1 Tax=Marinobacter santoriniensis NKSG1 TaxID=1288826 RepID=M7CRR4_9GAMM|nr:molybdopterin cofactor-binding domain-containing protein [Marinobacter santoriniensis]EMP54805.1 putative membrane-bound aldehyde dehydrogenase (pyrroloquinoline-quinone-linked) [Marinobacter santoriniensis NKSG1]